MKASRAWKRRSGSKTNNIFITYAGADHAFFNDTGMRYHQRGADQAWEEALGWLKNI